MSTVLVAVPTVTQNSLHPLSTPGAEQVSKIRHLPIKILSVDFATKIFLLFLPAAAF